jgi:hemoglobin/transferrin/lactoferrin receptor protein
MKKLFAVSITLFCLSAQAQIVVVKDEVTRQPIDLVTAMSWNPKAFTISDRKGQLDLSTFAGSDSIVFQELGHKEQVLSYAEVQALADNELILMRGEFDLDGITISASRWKQGKRDIPNKIISVNPEHIYFENPQTAADLLESTGEVYVQKSQLGGGSPMIRGFATNRVMISVDGVRMNNAIFRGGNVQNVISIDPLSIQNTEVVFGPGSVIYGSDAIGGVMSFYTIEPAFSQGEEPVIAGNALVRYSSANSEQTGHIDFNIGGKKWAFVTSLSYSNYDDLIMGSNGPDDYLRQEYVETTDGVDLMTTNQNGRRQISTSFSQYQLMQKVRFKPNEFWDITYSGRYSSTSDFGRYDRLIQYRGDTLHSAEWNYGPQEWMMHSVRVSNTSANKVYDKMNITAAYQSFKESRNERDFDSSFRTNKVERVYAPSINVDFEQDLGKRHELFFGLESVFNVVDSRASIKNVQTGNNALSQTRYPSGATWFSNSIYVSDRFRISRKLTLLSGVRYSVTQIKAQIDTTFLSIPVTNVDLATGALNGSVGLAYKPTEKIQFNINASTGFRAPNVDDVGKTFDSEPGSVVIPNASLRPEYAYNAEVGLIKIFKEFLKLETTIYYTFLNRAMVRRNTTLNGADSVYYGGELSQVQSIQNAANAQVLGVQLGAEYKIVKGLSLSTTFNYQKGEEELDDGTVAPLRHAPPMFGMVRLSYQYKRLRAQLAAQYNAKVDYDNLAPSERIKAYLYAKDGNGNPYTPAWYIVNCRVSYQLKQNFLITAGVENILDIRYRPYSSGIAAAGRNFMATVKYGF